jgi:hypothetical protein
MNINFFDLLLEIFFNLKPRHKRAVYLTLLFFSTICAFFLSEAWLLASLIFCYIWIYGDLYAKNLMIIETASLDSYNLDLVDVDEQTYTLTIIFQNKSIRKYLTSDSKEGWVNYNDGQRVTDKEELKWIQEAKRMIG